MRRRQIGRISLDDRSGDFIEYNGPLDINLRTLFNFRKPLPPRLDACTLKRAIPPQPQPLSYTWGTWLWGGAPLTGSQLDAIREFQCTPVFGCVAAECGSCRAETTSTAKGASAA